MGCAAQTAKRRRKQCRQDKRYRPQAALNEDERRLAWMKRMAHKRKA